MGLGKRAVVALLFEAALKPELLLLVEEGEPSLYKKDHESDGIEGDAHGREPLLGQIPLPSGLPAHAAPPAQPAGLAHGP